MSREEYRSVELLAIGLALALFQVLSGRLMRDAYYLRLEPEFIKAKA